MSDGAPPLATDPAPPFRGRRSRSRRLPLLEVVCALVLGLIAVCVVAGGYLAPYDPVAQDPILSVTRPGEGHLLGTDQLGRDVFSQLLAGARSAVLGPLVVAIGTLVIGASLGMVAAYYGGVLDTIVSRFADLVYALPAVLIAVVVVGVIGAGYWVTAAVLMLLSVPFEIRLCRSAAMVQVRLPYVDAARTLDLPAARIIGRHILPNILPTVVATFLLDFVGALIGFTSLTYLGFGVPAGSPNWGVMLAEGQTLLSQNPWIAIAPATMIIVTGASATVIGDWAHERLTQSGARA